MAQEYQNFTRWPKYVYINQSQWPNNEFLFFVDSLVQTLLQKESYSYYAQKIDWDKFQKTITMIMLTGFWAVHYLQFNSKNNNRFLNSMAQHSYYLMLNVNDHFISTNTVKPHYLKNR